ncbi:hypothetical protein Tco_1269277 [Tanacetum coccineum]
MRMSKPPMPNGWGSSYSRKRYFIDQLKLRKSDGVKTVFTGSVRRVEGDWFLTTAAGGGGDGGGSGGDGGGSGGEVIRSGSDGVVVAAEK